MATGEIVQNSVYCYKILDGELQCFEGHIVRYLHKKDVFYRRGTKKYYTVSEQPYEMHCGNVWMLERDDAFARTAFETFFNDKLDERRSLMQYYYDMLAVLKGDS